MTLPVHVSTNLQNLWDTIAIMIDLPFSQACENNKAPILEVLLGVFAHRSHVLEIGSGTAQHAVYFAEKLKHLKWQCSDRGENLAHISTRVKLAQLSNLLSPIELDVQQAFPLGFDAAFSANTAHIMPQELTLMTIKKVAEIIPSNGVYALYGPFNYQGKFTSDSNREFDLWLKSRAPHQGIRDFEKLDECANKFGLTLIEDHAMPANNRLLIWQKS